MCCEDTKAVDRKADRVPGQCDCAGHPGRSLTRDFSESILLRMEEAVQHREWQGRDGVRLAGERRMPHPPTDRPPILLAHGFAQTRKSWDSTMARFADNGYPVASYDARGHGGSDYAEPAAYRPDDFLKDMRLVCDRTGTRVVVGASLGGLIALLAAGEAPQVALDALVLVDVAPRWRADGQARIQKFLQARPEGFATLDDARQAVADYLPHRDPATSTGLLSNLRQGSSGRYYWHWDPAMLGMFRNVDIYQQRVLRAARNIRIPTLLVSGGQSELLGQEHIEECLELIPHAEHRQVARAHHMVAGDENSAFTDEVLSWLDHTLQQHTQSHTTESNTTDAAGPESTRPGHADPIGETA